MAGQESCKYDAEKELSALLAVLKIEQRGFEFYNKLAGCVADEKSKALLSGLAKDEEGHQNELTKQIERLSEGAETSGIVPASEYIEMIPSMVFPFPPPGACLALPDEVHALELALEVERKKCEMFRKVSELSTDCQLKDSMLMLAVRNEEHRKLLEEDLYYLRRGGSWYGYEPILDG